MVVQDMTSLKIRLSAILVGMVGVLALIDAGVFTTSHKAMNVGAVVVGGSLFGAGWALMGFCPGTSIGALGEGRWHALFAIAGMVAGAAIYAELYPWLNSTLIAWNDFGKISLPEALGLSHWIVAAIFWAACLLLFYFFEKKGL